MKARGVKARALLLAGLLVLPGLEGCSGDMVGLLQKIHPYVGKVLDGFGKGAAASLPKDSKPKAPGTGAGPAPGGAEGTSKPKAPKAVDDGSQAKPDPQAKPTELGALDRPRSLIP